MDTLDKDEKFPENKEGEFLTEGTQKDVNYIVQIDEFVKDFEIINNIDDGDIVIDTFLNTVFGDKLENENNLFTTAFKSGDLHDFERDVFYVDLDDKENKENNISDLERLKKLLENKNSFKIDIYSKLIELGKIETINFNGDLLEVAVDGINKINIPKNTKQKTNFTNIDSKNILSEEEFDLITEYFYGNISVLKKLLEINSEYIWLKGGKIGHIGDDKNSGRVNSANPNTFILPHLISQ